VSGLYDELEWRGLIHQVTDPSLRELLDREPLTVYIGFDPTAASLHVGSLLQLCNLRRVQEFGHRPVALAGGATGMIGDPSGKSDERSLLDAAQLEVNMAGLRGQLGLFLDFDPSAGPARAELVDNAEWLGGVGFLEFLRDVGKHFTVNQMIAKESVRARLTEREQGISYTEFSYMLLQAYDFLRLHERFGCRLQMGGSDQWGNITMGVELVRKKAGAEVFGLTSPLVLKADGTKFGKSESGSVWLDAGLTSPYHLFQHFVRVEDAVVGQYLRYFTWLSRDEIESLDAEVRDRPQERRAQRALAREVTSLVHGPDDAAAAEHAAGVLFSEEIAALDERTLLQVFSDAPAVEIPRTRLHDGLLAADLLSEAAGLSKSAARKTAEQGGLYVNNRRVDSVDAPVNTADLLHDRFVVLRKGKRDFFLVMVR
jgi:tyrosyl-tRNA synthetase